MNGNPTMKRVKILKDLERHGVKAGEEFRGKAYELDPQDKITIYDLKTGEARFNLYREARGDEWEFIPEPLSLEEARQKMEEARAEVVGANKKLQEASLQLQAAEERDRAANFKPNATMTGELLPMFSMSHEGPITPLLQKGERVHAVPGPYDFSDVQATRADGKVFKVAPELVIIDLQEPRA